jgi:hypothetical protein
MYVLGKPHSFDLFLSRVNPSPYHSEDWDPLECTCYSQIHGSFESALGRLTSHRIEERQIVVYATTALSH